LGNGKVVSFERWDEGFGLMDGKGGDLDWVLFVGLAGCWAGGKKFLRNLIRENGSRNALWGDNLRVGDLGLELWRANPHQYVAF
jgi:hypothetical protein